jgi:singapore isolate B (sub-type 7) whole genome shotgun sequence assembly, scaffold_0
LKNSVIDNVCFVVHREHELRPFIVASMGAAPQFDDAQQVRLGTLLFASRELWPLMMQLSAVKLILEGVEEERVISGCENLVNYLERKEMTKLWTVPSIINVREGRGREG